MKPVAIVMGSQTDYKVLKEAEKILKDFGVPFEVKVVSAHRTPAAMAEFAVQAHKKYSVIIAGAGGAAHLPGMIASFTTLPVIGVPVIVGKMGGLDALLSIAQMPAGIPVACMAVDGSKNAGLLALRILGIQSDRVYKKLTTYQKKLQSKVRFMNQAIGKKSSGRLKKR